MRSPAKRFLQCAAGRRGRLLAVLFWLSCAGAAAATPGGSALGVRSSLLPPLRLNVLQASQDAPAGGTTQTAGGADEWSVRRRYLVPVLFSVLVPGTGEIATGHFWRGIPLVAIDVATWLGYAHYNSEGKDARARYEQYADSHWDYARWQLNLATYYDESQPNPNLRWYDPNEPDGCTCTFISKEEDRQHYYENIGKYRFFWMGWDDWSYDSVRPVASDSAAHRRYYDDVRIESNDDFDHATSLVVVAMATRLVSVVQTVILVRSDLRSERLALEPRALPGHGSGLALTYHY